MKVLQAVLYSLASVLGVDMGMFYKRRDYSAHRRRYKPDRRS